MIIPMLPAIGKFGCCIRRRPADGARKLVAAELSGAFSVHFFVSFYLFELLFFIERLLYTFLH